MVYVCLGACISISFGNTFNFADNHAISGQYDIALQPNHVLVIDDDRKAMKMAVSQSTEYVTTHLIPVI